MSFPVSQDGFLSEAQAGKQTKEADTTELCQVLPFKISSALPLPPSLHPILCGPFISLGRGYISHLTRGP